MASSSIKPSAITKDIKEIYGREMARFTKEVADRAHLLILNIPFVSWNSFTLMIRLFQKKYYYVVVNRAAIKKEKTEEKMKFVTNSVLVHEIEHIRLLSNSYQDEEIDYMTFMSLLENVSYEVGYITKNLINRYLSRKALEASVKSLRYYSSSSELVCMSRGIVDSMSRYGNLLNEEDYSEMKRLIDAIGMIRQHFELRCVNPFRTENRFGENVILLARIYKKKKERIPKNTAIGRLIPNSNDFLNPIYMYERLGEFNKDLIDNMMLQTLLITKTDFSPLFFKYPESKEYVASLVNQYISEKNHFIVNSRLASELLNDDFLHENMAHIKRNFEMLKKKAAEYEIEILSKPAIWVN